MVTNIKNLLKDTQFINNTIDTASFKDKGIFAFHTLERYDSNKLSAMYILLRTIRRKRKFKDGDINRNFTTLKNLMESTDKYNITVFDNYIYKLVSYGFRHKHKNARIYPFEPSLVFFSREIRYLLFHNDYIDVDLINAHPSILYDFTKKYISDKKFPILKKVVTDRANLFKELDANGISNPKLEVLKTINGARVYQNELIQLNIELETIRNYIHTWFLNNESDTLAQLEKSDDYIMKTSRKKLIHLQSLYCYRIESLLLIQLKEFLQKKLLNSMHQDIVKEKVYSRYLEKNVEIPFDITIPFFDGLLFSTYPVTDPHLNFNAILNQFNESLEKDYIYIKFVDKKISYEYKTISLDLFERYVRIVVFLSNKSKKQVLKLLQFFNIKLELLNNEAINELVKVSESIGGTYISINNLPKDFLSIHKENTYLLEENLFESLLPYSNDNQTLKNLMDNLDLEDETSEKSV